MVATHSRAVVIRSLFIKIRNLLFAIHEKKYAKINYFCVNKKRPLYLEAFFVFSLKCQMTRTEYRHQMNQTQLVVAARCELGLGYRSRLVVGGFVVERARRLGSHHLAVRHIVDLD